MTFNQMINTDGTAFFTVSEDAGDGQVMVTMTQPHHSKPGEWEQPTFISARLTDVQAILMIGALVRAVGQSAFRAGERMARLGQRTTTDEGNQQQR